MSITKISIVSIATDNFTLNGILSQTVVASWFCNSSPKSLNKSTELFLFNSIPLLIAFPVIVLGDEELFVEPFINIIKENIINIVKVPIIINDEIFNGFEPAYFPIRENPK